MSLKLLTRATFGITLAALLLPVFVWLGLVVIGASVTVIIPGSAVTAWQLRKCNKIDPAILNQI
jgi:hypothetical protein